ncbi:MAG: Type restriction enzyme Eco57I, partial [Bacteroidetes bacterium]|nr:Type restriction enzyme Eco57I [Bacteroidota bacterium]
MNSEIFSFLKKHCSAKPKDVDRLIISAFLVKNNLVVDRNIFLKEFIITPEEKKEFVILTDFLVIVKKELSKFHFEELIELFEFVISPSDRIVSGAIYTPLNIRE